MHLIIIVCVYVYGFRLPTNQNMAATDMCPKLSCNICSNPFSDPRLLPCLHVFCKSCLEIHQSQNEGTLTCPSCCKTTSCRPSQLPKHLRIEREVDLLKVQQSDKVVCGTCDDNNKAESYCEDCVSPICSDCVTTHKRIKPLKGHSIVSFDSAQPQSHPVTCSLHSKENIKYYCFKCCSLICSECIIDHKLHRWVTIDKAAEIEKAVIESLLPKVEKSILPINKIVEKIEDVAIIVDQKNKEIAEELDRSVEEIIGNVNKRHADLLKELDDLTIAKKTQLDMQKEDFERMESGLIRVLNAGTSACKEYSGLEVLAVKGFIQQASRTLIEECRLSSLHPVTVGGPELIFNLSTVNKTVSSFGKINSKSEYPPLCSLVGVNPKLPIGMATDCECLFTLQTRNNKGEDLTEGGANVKGIIMHDLIWKLFECDICDLNNGKYEISFMSYLTGIYELYLTVNDAPVQDSPYSIKFIDYSKLSSYQIMPTMSPNYICRDSQNRLYVSTNEGSIEIYDDEEIVKLIPKSKHGGKHLRGMVIDDKHGVLFVASSGTNKVIKMDMNGEVIATIGSGKGSGELQFKYPTGLCLTKDGLLLVGDCNNNRVQVLGSDLSFIRFIECNNPVWGVSVDTGGNVHVGTTDCVEVFDIHAGEKITEYGQERFWKAGDIQFPNFQHPTKSTYSLVSHCIDVFDDGEICLYNWSQNKLLHSFKACNHPLGLTVDQEGTLYVCCYEDDVILSFIDN